MLVLTLDMALQFLQFLQCLVRHYSHLNLLTPKVNRRPQDPRRGCNLLELMLGHPGVLEPP
jgi:hypothetical protein